MLKTVINTFIKIKTMKMSKDDDFKFVCHNNYIKFFDIISLRLFIKKNKV